MTDSPSAVELTVEQAWFITDMIGAGTFPWVLAVTPPYGAQAERARFDAVQREALTRLGVIAPDGAVNPVVADWIRVVCFCDQWLDLRYVGPTSDHLMRGVIARRDRKTVVAMRSAQLITFTAMAIDHPHAVAPAVVAGLAGRAPARFPEFSMPARVGTRADERLRDGAKVADVVDFLGIPTQARTAVEAVFTGPRTYVEVVAGQRRDGHYTTSEIGVGIVDCPAGRIVVTPRRAPDGEWVSTFAPGTTWAIAVAIEALTAALPDGPWFPSIPLTREFTEASQA